MRPISRAALRSYVCPSCRHGIGAGRRRFGTKIDQTPDIYDVVCVGGGPAGLGLLAALRASPVTSKLKVALIESQDLNKARAWNMDSTQFSNRVSSLTPSSKEFLQKIGAWEHLDTERVQDYQEMQVWDGESGSRISFDWSMDTPAFEDMRTVATMTENANLVRGLLGRIAASGDENLKLFSNTTVAGIENGTDLQTEGPDLSAWPVLSIKPTGATAETQPSSRIAARLLVGADGINSPVRSFADITTHGWDYNRHGIVATLSLADPITPPFPAYMRTAYQRFLPALGGPIALLPLPNNHATLVWSTTPENAAHLKSLPHTGLPGYGQRGIPPVHDRSHLHDGHDRIIIRIYLPRGRALLAHSTHPPPRTNPTHGDRRANRNRCIYISPRVALVGDAAHVIHPLAGQGLNLGLADVAALSRTIEYAVSHGMDIGDLLTLERYSSERYLPNAKIGGACDLLHKMYNIPGQGPVTWARSLGLDVIDKLPFVKSFLMKNAEGY
ncbi:uncharacterized protein N7473_002271 [Penicillium subrubescens]|uniref:uncharacterized protein n=1 Tax=Penicillium subrubescens TaxID=1316194 RepID=UPI002544F81C|nr:uncharacterized protein N7473_002271 [Penicillium subrubescens]KAJ5905355.1 hypothetical protein N7473_002271 [Penicillium subrubescens]